MAIFPSVENLGRIFLGKSDSLWGQRRGNAYERLIFGGSWLLAGTPPLCPAIGVYQHATRSTGLWNAVAQRADLR